MDEALIAEYPELERSHFWWKVRRDLVRDIAKDVGIDGARVLDVGCGSGITAAMLADLGGRVVGVDTSFLGSTGSNIQFVQGDYLEAADSLGEFDFVLALDSVEHFEDESRVLQAIAKNVAAGGSAVVTVPAYGWLWSQHDETNQHFRRYTRSRLAEAIARTGLRVDRVGYLFGGLVPVKAALALVEKLAGRSMGAGTEIGSFSNMLATGYFGFETRTANRLDGFLPFGTSVVAIAKKVRT